ncbi:Ger(x)C family spore germination protein [Paenibacillus sp. NFR01]|uniref:Ger(x)C family spore germination protein n=1 Tax=Paenibacillus sp. NFR01 TaxID=1566279 RepID=UPI0008B5BB7D|nr:Ger(x)C family spore germination protein [Paenibacillus sp. NFR01]SET21197.1 germination protein, Ger(x)C family [Paenibacillus sp. NFR01]
MKWRFVWLTCLLCGILPLVGCWDAKDIDNRMIVGAMGVERPEKDKPSVRVWFRFPIPKTPGTSGNGSDFFATSQAGDTVIDATNQMRYRLPKALDLSSVRAFLIDETMAKEGLRQYLDFTVRERSVPLDTVVALVTGDMNQIFSNPNPTGELSGLYTKLFFEPFAGGIPRKNKVELWEVYAKLYNPLQANLIPLVRESEHNMFSLVGNAYFAGDKLAGILTPDETLLYEIISRSIGETEMELTKKADVKILNNRTRIKASLKADGHPLIRVTSRVDCTLVNSSGEERLSASRIEQYLEQKLIRQAAGLFAKTQAKRSDIFGFGNHFRGKLAVSRYPSWPSMYQQAEIRFKIKVKLRNTGLEYLE